MAKSDLLARLHKYLTNIVKSEQFDKNFSASVKGSYRSIVYNSTRLSKLLKEDPDDIIQHIIIELWLSMKDFFQNHFVVDKVPYTLHKMTDQGMYLKSNREVRFFDKSRVESATTSLYAAIFFKRLVQICADYVNYKKRLKRGLQVDHVFLYDTVQDEDGVYYFEDMLGGVEDSPENSYSYEELVDIIYEDLSDYAKIYFDAVSFMPPGPIEGWSKPLKLYKRELLHARAELYRTYMKKIKGYDLSESTDLLFRDIKDPYGLNERCPVHLSAGVLKR